MGRVTYDIARSDFEFLESIIELDDQVEMDAERLSLMRNPTKQKAAGMYSMGVRLWFKERRCNAPHLAEGLEDIAERHDASTEAGHEHG